MKPLENFPVDERLRGAIWGQFVGDAAALGAHWIYDLDELKDRFPEGVQGFETPLKDDYHFGKNPGDQTHYGDGALVLLESIAEEQRFDPVIFGQSFVTAFDPRSYRGYIDKATRGTLENFQAFSSSQALHEFDFQSGADDDQLAGASRMASLVAKYWSNPKLLDVVAQATRVCQNNLRSIGYMKFHALFLRELFLGNEIRSALDKVGKEMVDLDSEIGPEIYENIARALSELPLDVSEATQKFGQSCPLPHSFPSALHVLLKMPDQFAPAIQATLSAGGDNAGRAAMLGSWLGAYLGVKAIPEEWISRLTHRDRISRAMGKLIESEAMPVLE